jgi:5-methylcytosine-specific restriction endonuclease McrA
MKRERPVCRFCGKRLKLTTATVDHLVPLSRGGDRKPNNTGLACHDCNSNKGNRTEEEFVRWLRNQLIGKIVSYKSSKRNRRTAEVLHQIGNGRWVLRDTVTREKIARHRYEFEIQ